MGVNFKLINVREWVVVVILGLMAVRTGQNVVRLWRAGERVTEAEQSLAEARSENERLQARLTEVKSEEFIEKEAREKLGFGREGEVILILPEHEGGNGEDKKDQAGSANWKKWWDLYIGQ